MTVIVNRRRFRERATPSTDHRVNREGGVVRSVRICGDSSINNRRYPARVLQAAVPLYEGVRVYLDHDYSRTGNDRPLTQWIGVLENVRFESNALWGDLRLRKESQHFASVMEAAEGFSRAFGLSHVVDCDSHRDGKFEVVDEIIEVISVDVVSNPAMNRGLFESVDSGARGGLIGGGIDGLALDAAFQQAADIVDRLGGLAPATQRNLGLVAKGQDPEFPELPDGRPMDVTGYLLIDAVEVREIQKALATLCRWWISIEVRPEAKEAADELAKVVQQDSMKQKTQELQERIATLEAKHRDRDQDEAGDRIFEARQKRNEELRAKSGRAPLRTSYAMPANATPEEIFESRQRRLEELRRAKGLVPR